MTASPIHRDAAAEATHRLIRDALTASDLDPDTPSPEGSSELHLLPQVLPHLHLPPGLIAKWIADGEDIEATDRAGRTPLHYATQYGRNADLVNALLAAGADTHARDEDGQIPLHRAAAFSENVEVLAALLKSGAAHDARDDRNRTPLHLAASEGRFAAVTALLAAGADIKARDRDGATPFRLAAARNDTAEFVAALKSAGKIGNDHDESDRTPPDHCRSEQFFAPGVLGLLFAFLAVATLLIYLLVSWPVSWLAYWLIEDPVWRLGVKNIVSSLGTIWIWWRGLCWWTTN